MRKFLFRSIVIAGLFGLTSFSTVATAQTPASEAQIGKRLFLRCVACHAVSAAAPTKVGPHLQGIVGRKSGSVSSFAYSPGMRAANLTWNETTLDKWLAKPRAVVPNTTMAFAGLSDPAQRRILIAYLKKPAP